jgi:hypothetical protein
VEAAGAVAETQRDRSGVELRTRWDVITFARITDLSFLGVFSAHHEQRMASRGDLG